MISTSIVPAPAPASFPSGLPVLRLGFRPFYLGAAAIAVFWMGLWGAMLTGRMSLPSGMPPVLWHAHEMLFGFATAVIAGFLLTAGRVWTGRATPRGGSLALLWLLWLAGRIASVTAPPVIFAALDSAFLLTMALLFGALIVRSRSTRNLPIAAVLLLLATANLGFHLASIGTLSISPMTPLLVGLALIVVLTSIIGGRVIPAFTQSVSPGWKATEPRWLSPAALAMTALGLALWISATPAVLSATALAVAAILQGVRLKCWSNAAMLRRPILWALHISYAWTPLGLGLLAAAEVGWVPVSAGVHALAVGCIGGLILAMMTRTARGHTGRPLHASAAEVTGYVLVSVAALARVIATMLPWQAQGLALLLAGGAWTAAFALYLARFSVWLTTTRLDGRDG